MGDLDMSGKGVPVGGEPVILRGDRDFPGAQVFDRMIAAAVPELQFESGPAERVGEDLMPETDPEDRLFLDDLLDLAVDLIERGRVAGSVREENAVGIACQHLGRGGAGIDHFDLEPFLT